MLVLLKILHIIVAVALIMIVLFQTGKGAEMGAAFGGSSQTLFGGGGPAGFMAKLTTAAAVGFMLTSLTLAYLASTHAKAGKIPAAPPPIEVPAGGEEAAPGEGTSIPAPLTQDGQEAEPAQ